MKNIGYKMRPTIMLIVMIVLFGFTSVTFSANSKDNKSLDIKEVKSDIQQLNHDVKDVKNDIDILHRDQINYTMEKDLLKDNYSTTLQGINTVITIVFGLFGVIGYLGLRSMKEIRTDYTNELENLRKLKIKFESELETLEKNQKIVESKLGSIDDTNDNQDKRLQVLELIEKVSVQMQMKNYEWALKYITIGLSLDPNNLILLNQKSTCLGKLGEFTSAIESCKLILDKEPENSIILSNLLEFLIFSNKLEEFETVYSKNVQIVNKVYSGNLNFYLNTLNFLLKNDFNAASTLLTELGTKLSKTNDTKKILGDWQFDEISKFVSSMPDSKKKDLFVFVIRLFQTQNANDFNTLLTEMTASIT